MNETVISDILQESKDLFKKSFPGETLPRSWRDREELQAWLEELQALNLTSQQRATINEAVAVFIDLADNLDLMNTHNQKLVFKAVEGLQKANGKIDALTRKEECDKDRPWNPN